MFKFLVFLVIVIPANAGSRPPELIGVALPVALEPILIEAVRDHNQARNGTKGLAAKVVERLEKAQSEISPDHPVVMGYLGSAYTLMARDAGSVSDALRYTNRGIRIMNAAVDIAPELFVVRAVRAFNNIALPVMFERRKSALRDMEQLVVLYEKAPLPQRQPVVKMALETLIQTAEAQGKSADAERWKAKMSGLSLD